MANIGTRIFTWARGERVGEDSLGNVYYRERGGGRTSPLGFGRQRRWVIYKGEPEATKIPPGWHAWLHHTQEEPPTSDELVRPWEKPHEANPTGTDAAYRPPGHTLKGAARAKATGDYEPWIPS